MPLIRHRNGTPLVSLPALGPAPPPPAALATIQHMADRDGIVYRLPNGYTVKPRPKKPRRRRARLLWLP